jgi:hypothetical protein
MQGMTTLQYFDKQKRDEVYDRLRQSEEPNECQVIRYSDPVPMMLNDEEFRLDASNRVVYRTAYFLAYPEECTWKRLKRKSAEN